MHDATTAKHPVAMTIAGSDSSGGAGIQADLKTFSALGVYGTSVIVALTAQNTQGVRSIHAAPASFVTDQMEMVWPDIPPDAVKTGMLFNKEIIGVVAEAINRFSHNTPLIIDPVMVSQSGDRLLEADAIEVLTEKLFPLATLVTPNLPEAEVLLGRTLGDTENPASIAAELGKKTGCSILLKGGHTHEGPATDYLFYKKKNKVYPFEQERINTSNTHGTGCTLSSAIAACMARQKPLTEAVEEAKSYMAGAIQAGAFYTTGRGSGPVHHFFRQW